jgi:spore coat protein CotF
MTSIKKVENPKTPLSKKSTVDDSDILSAALATEKNLCISYAMAMNEASHGKFNVLLSNMFKETSQQHRKLLDLQFQHGWRSLTPAAPEDIATLKQESTENRQLLK